MESSDGDELPGVLAGSLSEEDGAPSEGMSEDTQPNTPRVSCPLGLQLSEDEELPGVLAGNLLEEDCTPSEDSEEDTPRNASEARGQDADCLASDSDTFEDDCVFGSALKDSGMDKAPERLPAVGGYGSKLVSCRSPRWFETEPLHLTLRQRAFAESQHGNRGAEPIAWGRQISKRYYGTVRCFPCAQ